MVNTKNRITEPPYSYVEESGNFLIVGTYTYEKETPLLMAVMPDNGEAAKLDLDFILTAMNWHFKLLDALKSTKNLKVYPTLENTKMAQEIDAIIQELEGK